MKTDDPGVALNFWNEKWRDWHKRLRDVEDSLKCLPEIRENVEKLLEIIAGPIGEPQNSLCSRVMVLESWRESFNTRTKAWKGWVFGVLGSVIGSCVTAAIIAAIINKNLG